MELLEKRILTGLERTRFDLRSAHHCLLVVNMKVAKRRGCGNKDVGNDELWSHIRTT